MTAIVADLRARQLEAIKESGWGRSFDWWQPRNAAQWTYILLFIAGLWSAWHTIGEVSYAYESALVLAIVVSAVVTAVIGWFLFHLDRFGTVPPGLAVVAFGWGAVVAPVGIAGWANDAVVSLWSKGVGPVFAAHWAAALTAPFTEEIIKGMGILLLVALAPRLVRSAYDGLLLGTIIALGFQVVEDVLYAVNSAAAAFGADQVTNSGRTIGVRLLTAIPSHWMYSGVFCAGLVWFLGRPDFPPRRALGLACMLGAMLFHGLWDGISGFGAITPALGFVVPALVAVALFVVFVRVYRAAAAGEGNWMRDILAVEQINGIVEDRELDAVAGSRHTRKQFLKTVPRGRSRRATRHVLEATTELGLRIAKDNGADTAQVQHLRAEVVRLRQQAAGLSSSDHHSLDL